MYARRRGMGDADAGTIVTLDPNLLAMYGNQGEPNAGGQNTVVSLAPYFSSFLAPGRGSPSGFWNTIQAHSPALFVASAALLLLALLRGRR